MGFSSVHVESTGVAQGMKGKVEEEEEEAGTKYKMHTLEDAGNH